LAFQGVDNVHGCDGLPLGMFGVCDGITDDVLQENFEDPTGLLIDEARDTLHTTSASKTTDGRLGDALDVVTKYFTMTLGAPLSKSLSSFTTARHVEVRCDLYDNTATNDEKFNSTAIYRQKNGGRDWKEKCGRCVDGYLGRVLAKRFLVYVTGYSSNFHCTISISV
jgi:hypothetical protein